MRTFLRWVLALLITSFVGWHALWFFFGGPNPRFEPLGIFSLPLPFGIGALCAFVVDFVVFSLRVCPHCKWLTMRIKLVGDMWQERTCFHCKLNQYRSKYQTGNEWAQWADVN